jgi:hypothetical protein
MDNQQALDLNLEISASDASAEELDSLTRQLLSELREVELESAQLTSGEVAPAGTKSVDPVTIGALAIAVLPNLLPKLVDVVSAWALRGQGRTVKFKGKIGGQTIQFEGTSDELQKLIAALSQPKTQSV